MLEERFSHVRLFRSRQRWGLQKWVCRLIPPITLASAASKPAMTTITSQALISARTPFEYAEDQRLRSPQSGAYPRPRYSSVLQTSRATNPSEVPAVTTATHTGHYVWNTWSTKPCEKRLSYSEYECVWKRGKNTWRKASGSESASCRANRSSSVMSERRALPSQKTASGGPIRISPVCVKTRMHGAVGADMANLS